MAERQQQRSERNARLNARSRYATARWCRPRARSRHSRLLRVVTGTIRRWNSAATALFGYSAVGALGQKLDLIIRKDLRAAHWRSFESAITTGVMRLQGRPTLTRATHQTGRRLYVEMIFSLVQGTSRWRGAVAVARDVTERIEQQRAENA